MTPPVPTRPPSPRPRSGQPLRLHSVQPSEAHPLTTVATPLLPPRGEGGATTDVWEELDRAAAWLCDAWWDDPTEGKTGVGPDDRDAVRQALRVLCVAARAADAAGGAGHPAGARPGIPMVEAHDLPWNVPIDRLLRALRRRLVAQSAAAAAGEPRPDPWAVLRVLAVLDGLDETRRADPVRTVVDQLTGATSLDLLVEIAHDMRSPLGSILLLVERLRLGAGGGGGELTEAQDHQLALIYGAAFGLSAMAGDVMELARGGDRLAGGEPAPLLLPAVIDGVCAIAQPLAEEKRLALVVGAVAAEPRVGHEAAIHRVLLNLTTNALKYTREGSVTIHAEARGRDRVAFVVEDTGPGVPPHVLTNLFRTFRQRPASGHAFSSAGLGLAICQKLIGAMGGTLEVESDAERGTRFQFELELPPLPHPPLPHL